MKKIIKRVGLTLVALVLLLSVGLTALYFYSKNYCPPAPASTVENATGLVQAVGRGLYDAEGNLLQLRGINAGQILVQEGWMSPFALEPEKNADGSFVKDGDGNLQYPEFSEEDLRAGLAANPNLKEYDLEQLLQLYRSSFFTEEDFRIIREDLQMNVIRLPFYYRDILNDDLSLRAESEAFSYLDWFVSQAAAQRLYVILDLHGAPGGQNGYEHSGKTDGKAELWSSEENIAATVALWDAVSEHYTKAEPELGKWIASYDILNEPTDTGSLVTTRNCWNVFDRIYDTIRENGDCHVITMEGCWDFSRLPDPAEYGWQNVQYEYHWYNWWSDILPNALFVMYQDFFNLGRDYEVPVLIGEFTMFEDRQAWAQQLALFDSRGYSWTIWNYKTTVTGWWTSSWGVYTAQLHLAPETEAAKCNVATCTYEEFTAACQAMRTENCATGTLWEVLQAYNGQ